MNNSPRGEVAAGAEAFLSRDPLQARDRIVAYFHDTHRETFAQARRHLGAPAGEREVHEAVLGAVKLVFRSVGADFSKPTRQALLAVVDVLARKAAVWGVPRLEAERHARWMRSAAEGVET